MKRIFLLDPVVPRNLIVPRHLFNIKGYICDEVGLVEGHKVMYYKLGENGEIDSDGKISLFLTTGGYCYLIITIKGGKLLLFLIFKNEAIFSKGY